MVEEDFETGILFRSTQAFEGASTNYKIGSKGLVYGNDDVAAARALIYLQLRSQYAINNNPYAVIGLKRWKQLQGTVDVSWVATSGKNKGKTHQQMQDLWNEFIDNPFIENIGNWVSLQDLWKTELFIQGTNFTRFRLFKEKNKNKVPLKLEPISASLHDCLYTDADKRIFNGIRYDSNNVPVSYFFRKDVRKSSFQEQLSLNSFRVELSADELCRGLSVNKVGQNIGIPLLAPSLLVLYDLDELADATLNRQKNAQAISWMVEDHNVTPPLAIGGVKITPDSETNEDKISFEAVGGNVQTVPKGKKVTFATVDDIGANFQILVDRQLARVAASLDLDYHLFTGDVSGLNFAIIKALGHSARERREYFHNTVTIPRNLVPLTEIFKTYASLRYPGVDSAKAQFLQPRYFGADELKDAQADVLELKYGLTTLARCLKERGITPEELLADIEMQKELGVYDLLKANANSTKQTENIESNSNSTGN